MKELTIGRAAYDKIMYYVHKAKGEISGLGVVEVIDGFPTVTDIVLLKQECAATETELDANAIAQAEYIHTKGVIDGTKTGELRFWWHSHVNMGVFWSPTDHAAIKQLTEHGWFTHGVFNKKGECRLAYTNNEPFPVFLDDLDLEINESLVSQEMIALINKQEEECDDLFEALVTEKTYGAYYNGNYPYNNYYKDKKYNQETKQWELETPVNNVTSFPKNESYATNYEREAREELVTAGFSDEQIKYLNDACQIFDLEDAATLEEHVGDLKEYIDDLLALEKTANIN